MDHQEEIAEVDMLHTLRPNRSDEWIVIVLCTMALCALVMWLLRTGATPGYVDIDEAKRQPAEFQVDLATATWPQLAQIPRVGEKLAKRIIESRETEGPFNQPSDLLRVKGIGPQTLALIKPYLRDPPSGTEAQLADHPAPARERQP